MDSDSGCLCYNESEVINNLRRSVDFITVHEDFALVVMKCRQFQHSGTVIMCIAYEDAE